MFINQSSSVGGLSTGIPGEIYGYWQAHKIAGRLPWKTLFEPTIKLCREGFRISKVLGNAIKISEKYIRLNRGLSQIFLNKKTNQLYQYNDIIKMPNLADTLEILSHDHINAFYDSDLTRNIIQEINDNGGNVTFDDFKSYKALVKDAIYDYIDDELKLITAPVPSNGILVSFILKLMRGFNLSEQTLHDENESLLYHHRLVESFKHAFAYRSMLGDEKDNENITRVIRNLRDRKFIEKIREKIVDFQTFPASYYGMPHDRDNSGTAHISVLAGGDAVALTSTINSYFGGKYVGEKTGIIYNNQMDDFSTPNMSNLYGIAPSEANFIKPGKRPLSTMSPVIIVDKGGNVRLVIGASGGSKILTAVAQVS
jgi:gamma-glutamyltranspeptidase/glutathione hydrolase/leukotriene-C4 hydrolase